MASFVALLAAVAAGVAQAVHHNDARVNPDLEHTDKKFFKKDYPWDKRPVADKHYAFDHPYPAVQDTGDYDRDFVKDENNDGGRWKAQMTYDILRSKIRQAEKDLAAAKAIVDKEEAEWKSAKDKFESTSADADSAGTMRAKAEKEAAAAAKKVNDLEGASGKDGTRVGGAVGDAVKKVNDEMSDLEKCKKELAAAKKRLKELIKEKEEMDKKEAAEDAANKKALEDALTGQKNKAKQADKLSKKEKAQADAKVSRAEAEVEKELAEEGLWKKKLAAEKEESAKATKSYEEELADVKRTEAQLKEAEKNLRKYRRPPHVDGNGGVYYEDDEKSGARHSSMAAAALLTLAAFAMH